MWGVTNCFFLWMGAAAVFPTHLPRTHRVPAPHRPMPRPHAGPEATETDDEDENIGGVGGEGVGVRFFAVFPATHLPRKQRVPAPQRPIPRPHARPATASLAMAEVSNLCFDTRLPVNGPTRCLWLDFLV